MRRHHDLRNALLCAAAITLAFLIVNPFVNMPFDDDWSYSYTVRQFLATGAITYNGWSAPLIITQALWGAMFCKIFGYSFVTLRFSTLPFDIGSAIFSYLLARGANLRPAAAVCVSLTLCLSPLFLPLALSFMTDVPGLCCTLICLYALMRAGQSAGSRPALIWLTIGLLVGILGGMARQTVWLAPLCVIPYLIILRRSDRPFAAAAILAWLIVVIDMVVCLRWFVRQPNIYIDPPLSKCIRKGLDQPGIAVTNLIMVVFTIVMFSLPAVLPFTLDSLRRLWRQRNSWRGALTAAVVLGLSAAISAHPAFGMGPWLHNIVTPRGVIGPLELSGNRPAVLPLFVRGIISALVLMTTYLLAARAIEFAVDFRRSLARLRHFFAVPDSRPILAIFAFFYFGLMVIRSGQDQVFDRYCLPLMLCLAIFLLRGRSLVFAWPLVVIFAVYALASTQDILALAAGAEPPSTGSKRMACPAPRSPPDSNLTFTPSSKYSAE